MNLLDDRYLNINKVAREAHQNATAHGFYEDQDNLEDYLAANDQPHLCEIARRNFILAQLAKICGEVGECVAVVQKSPDYQALGEELADIAIRTMDLASYMGYQHGTDIMMKMAKNRFRPYKHGKIC